MIYLWNINHYLNTMMSVLSQFSIRRRVRKRKTIKYTNLSKESNIRLLIVGYARKVRTPAAVSVTFATKGFVWRVLLLLWPRNRQNWSRTKVNVPVAITRSSGSRFFSKRQKNFKCNSIPTPMSPKSRVLIVQFIMKRRWQKRWKVVPHRSRSRKKKPPHQRIKRNKLKKKKHRWSLLTD